MFFCVTSEKFDSLSIIQLANNQFLSKVSRTGSLGYVMDNIKDVILW